MRAESADKIGIKYHQANNGKEAWDKLQNLANRAVHDGESLRDLIEQKQTNHGNYVVTEWDYRGPIQPNYMIVKDGWKLMIPYTKGSKILNVLYHLNEDPHEMNNLLGNNPDRRKYKKKAEELRTNLLKWLKKNNSKHYEGVSKRKLI